VGEAEAAGDCEGLGEVDAEGRGHTHPVALGDTIMTMEPADAVAVPEALAEAVAEEEAVADDVADEDAVEVAVEEAEAEAVAVAEADAVGVREGPAKGTSTTRPSPPLMFGPAPFAADPS
jgi:hypothetical protein